MHKLLLIAGARPNFVKLAPVLEELEKHRDLFNFRFAITGQHYDSCLSSDFLEDLRMPDPDILLNVGSGSHAQQTAWIMVRLEGYLLRWRPDLVIVPGDTNSTLAAALAAAKMNIPVAHIESGLRSFDRTMPEEINRIVTDHVSSIHFVTEEAGRKNLLKEGMDESSIRFVGNTMIDSLMKFKGNRASSFKKESPKTPSGDYVVVTLHRPSNTDNGAVLKRIMMVIAKIAEEIPVVFPIHPRTRLKIDQWGLADILSSGVMIIDPLSYPDFLELIAGARLVLTDSGGVQEETTALEVPCLTLRDNTERPCTVEFGTNKVIGTKADIIINETRNAFQSIAKAKKRPPLWDGQAAARIVKHLVEHFQNKYAAA